MKSNKQIANERYLTVQDICVYLNVTDETVYCWIKDSDIPAHRVGRRWMFDRDELDSWIKSGKAGERCKPTQ